MAPEARGAPAGHVSPFIQLAIAAVCWSAACWPLWLWYGHRVFAVPDQAWFLLAPLTAGGLALTKGSVPFPETTVRRWLPPALAMAVYAATYPFLPMPLRALPALAALLFLPGPWRRGFRPDPAVAGLCLIGLPAMAMLQFYFGSPLRAASAALAVPMLHLAGFQVVREGAMLDWAGRSIGVDVPCSGIRMGWAGLYMALAGTGLAGLGWGRTLTAAAGAMILVVAANAVRVVVLFGLEAFGLGGRPVLHAGIGIMLFILLALGIAGLVRALKGRAP